MKIHQLELRNFRMLLELRKADGVPQRAKDRAEVIRLSSQGWKVKKIATYLVSI